MKPVWDITFEGNEKHVQIVATQVYTIDIATVVADGVQIGFDDVIEKVEIVEEP